IRPACDLGEIAPHKLAIYGGFDQRSDDLVVFRDSRLLQHARGVPFIGLVLREVDLLVDFDLDLSEQQSRSQGCAQYQYQYATSLRVSTSVHKWIRSLRPTFDAAAAPFGY